MKYKDLQNTLISPKKIIRGGYHEAVNITSDGCAPTVTTRYDAIGCTNILSLAHYPMCAVLNEYEI